VLRYKVMAKGMTLPVAEFELRLSQNLQNSLRTLRRQLHRLMYHWVL
jgi:hypothetical protein